MKLKSPIIVLGLLIMSVSLEVTLPVAIPASMGPKLEKIALDHVTSSLLVSWAHLLVLVVTIVWKELQADLCPISLVM